MPSLTVNALTVEMSTDAGVTFQMTPMVERMAEKSKSKRPAIAECSSKAKAAKVATEATLPCEWEDCQQVEGDLASLALHVSDHLKGMMRENGDSSGWTCPWRLCGFESTSSSEMARHVNFHVFHTKIKSVGAGIVRETNIQPCQLDSEQRNLLPDLSEPFICQWEGCADAGREWAEAHRFYQHVSWHADDLRDFDGSRKNKAMSRGVRGVRSRICCGWSGCAHETVDISKLRAHLRSHTQERQVGCPVCGGLFANRVKFFDHCVRQDDVAR